MKRLFNSFINRFGDFMIFSRRESNGALVLLVILAMILFSPHLMKPFYQSSYLNFDSDQQVLNEVLSSLNWNEAITDSIDQEVQSLSLNLFRFDPNTVSQEALVQLGLKQQQAQRLINYRAKGGRFAVKADLLKVYGLPLETYQELYNYIDLPEERPLSKPAAMAVSDGKKPVVAGKEKNTTNFDINEADTIQLKEVKGIGSVLSNRIIRYRESLGGFISANQVREVYGLNDEVADALIARVFISADYLPEQLNINKVDAETLAKHPYISKKLSSQITSYRSHHGLYKNQEDLKKIKEVDDSVLIRVAPYLNFETIEQ